MSVGSGLWFVVCIPTQEYELEKFETNKFSNNRPPDYESSIEHFQSNETTSLKSTSTTSLEQVLKKTLEELNIYDALWVLDETKKYYKVTFACHAGLRCDIVLTTLSTNGIGMCKGSSLGILPCSVLLQDNDFSPNDNKSEFETSKLFLDEKKSDSGSTVSKTKSDIKKAFRSFKDMQKKFLKSVTARLTVAQVVDGVRSGSEISFDFIIFVIIASMIAALGLLENSTVVIVASMLISPIMGPIMAGTFGIVIRDKSLRNLGIKAELLGLFLCVVFGFIFGLMGSPINDLSDRGKWPTKEMLSRGENRNLWIGLLVALPSGVGVALSLLGGNAGCLVGVAISASLLPPTVNAGLLWGLAVIKKIKADEEENNWSSSEDRMFRTKPSLIPPPDYKTQYYDEMDKECAMLGLVSLGLALINIVCIFISAIIVLKIKEVAPRTSLSKTSRFWKEDIKIARDYNTTNPPAKPEELGNQFLAEWASLNGLEPEEVLSEDEEATITRIETLKDIIHDVEADDVYQTITNSVAHNRETRPLSQRLSAMQNVQITVPEEDRNLQRRSYIPSWISRTNDAQKQFPEVQLRGKNKEPGTRDSVAILRQSLANTTNPFTLWPSTSIYDNRNRYRNTMEPVLEEIVIPVPVCRRISRFLQGSEIVHETSC